MGFYRPPTALSIVRINFILNQLLPVTRFGTQGIVFAQFMTNKRILTFLIDLIKYKLNELIGPADLTILVQVEPHR